MAAEMIKVKSPIRPDEILVNADWNKQSWDLPLDVDGFLVWLGEPLQSWEQFKALPAYRAMPLALKAGLKARGYDVDG